MEADACWACAALAGTAEAQGVTPRQPGRPRAGLQRDIGVREATVTTCRLAGRCRGAAATLVLPRSPISVNPWKRRACVPGARPRRGGTESASLRVQGCTRRAWVYLTITLTLSRGAGGPGAPERKAPAARGGDGAPQGRGGGPAGADAAAAARGRGGAPRCGPRPCLADRGQGGVCSGLWLFHDCRSVASEAEAAASMRNTPLCTASWSYFGAAQLYTKFIGRFVDQWAVSSPRRVG